MKKFVRIIICLLVFLFLFVLGLDIFATYQIRNYKASLTSTVVVGDSHTQCAINPNVIDDIQNFSHSSEPLFFSFQKVEYVVHHSISPIQYIILGFSYHNMSYSSSQEQNRMFMNYFWMLDKQILSEHFHMTKSAVLFKNIFKEDPIKRFYNETGGLHVNCLSEWGGFHESVRSNVSKTNLADAISRHYNEKTIDVCCSDFNSILELCHENAIKLVLITTPLTPDYYNSVPEDFKSKFYALISELEQDSAVVYLDYSQFDMQCITNYGDADHINEKGSELFSKDLNDTLNEIRSGCLKN